MLLKVKKVLFFSFKTNIYQQFVLFSVMRLSRPLLYNPPVVESDPWDLPGKYLEHCVPSDSFDPTENISVENNVILPQGFGYTTIWFPT